MHMTNSYNVTSDHNRLTADAIHIRSGGVGSDTGIFWDDISSGGAVISRYTGVTNNYVDSSSISLNGDVFI